MHSRLTSRGSRIVLAALLPLAGAAAVLATGQPAFAAPTCPSGEVCLYDSPNATGARATYRVGDSNFAAGTPLFNDRLESWQNNSGRRFCWYIDANYRGQSFIMENYGQRVVNLKSTEINRASSLRAC